MRPRGDLSGCAYRQPQDADVGVRSARLRAGIMPLSRGWGGGLSSLSQQRPCRPEVSDPWRCDDRGEGAEGSEHRSHLLIGRVGEASTP